MLQWISYLLTRGFVEAFRIVPFRLLYILSDGVAFILYRVVGYRKEVIMNNLRLCFPEKTTAELADITKASYRNLADIMLESIKGTTASLRTLNSRYRYTNYEIINAVLDQGRSVVLVGGHYNNWEWGVQTIGGGIHGNTIGVYKPMTNRLTDRWFFRTRSRDGKMILKSMKDTYQSVEEYRGRPTVFILVADQTPSSRNTAIWVDFFGQDTACLPGSEQIARKNDYPIFMYDIQRLKRGHYELSFREVNLQPAQAEQGVLTQQFMTMIEHEIRQDPGNWLWSHRRWKMKR